MESQIEYNQDTDEEISLIDLFAVLLRYRKLIIIGTLAATFLAGLYLFVLPVIAPALSREERTVTYFLGVAELPSSLRGELFGDQNNMMMKMVVNSMNNTQLFASIYRENPIFSVDRKLPEGAEFNLMVKNLMAKEIKVEEVDNSINMTINIPVVNLEKGEAFVAAYLAAVNQQVNSVILPQIERIKNTGEIILASGLAEQAGSNASSQELQWSFFEAREYLASSRNAVYVIGEPLEISAAQGRLMKLVIVAFAAFFVTVFIAFVLNAINNVKADPQASKVISDAWKAGK